MFFRLFKTDLQLPSTVLISLTIKVESSNPPDVALQLHVDKQPNYIMLCPTPEDNAAGKCLNGSYIS